MINRSFGCYRDRQYSRIYKQSNINIMWSSKGIYSKIRKNISTNPCYRQLCKRLRWHFFCQCFHTARRILLTIVCKTPDVNRRVNHKLKKDLSTALEWMNSQSSVCTAQELTCIIYQLQTSESCWRVRITFSTLVTGRLRLRNIYCLWLRASSARWNSLRSSGHWFNLFFLSCV